MKRRFYSGEPPNKKTTRHYPYPGFHTSIQQRLPIIPELVRYAPHSRKRNTPYAYPSAEIYPPLLGGDFPS